MAIVKRPLRKASEDYYKQVKGKFQLNMKTILNLFRLISVKRRKEKVLIFLSQKLSASL